MHLDKVLNEWQLPSSLATAFLVGNCLPDPMREGGVHRMLLALAVATQGPYRGAPKWTSAGHQLLPRRSLAQGSKPATPPRLIRQTLTLTGLRQSRSEPIPIVLVLVLVLVLEVEVDGACSASHCSRVSLPSSGHISRVARQAG